MRNRDGLVLEADTDSEFTQRPPRQTVKSTDFVANTNPFWVDCGQVWERQETAEVI